MCSQGESHNTAGKTSPKNRAWGLKGEEDERKLWTSKAQCHSVSFPWPGRRELRRGDYQPVLSAEQNIRFAIKIRPIRQHAVLKHPRKGFSYFIEAKSGNVMEKDRLPL